MSNVHCVAVDELQMFGRVQQMYQLCTSDALFLQSPSVITRVRLHIIINTQQYPLIIINIFTFSCD